MFSNSLLRNDRVVRVDYLLEVGVEKDVVAEELVTVVAVDI